MGKVQDGLRALIRFILLRRHAWRHVVFVLLVRARGYLIPRVLPLLSGSLVSAVTSGVKRKIEMIKWKNRIFLHRLQVVLLFLEPIDGDCELKLGRVEKRTMFEGNLLDTIMNGNQAAAAISSRAASQCTTEMPFLTQHLEAGERYAVLNNALNLVSSLTPLGHLAHVIAPESSIGCWFVFALTVNNVQSKRPETPNTKVRIALVREDTLLFLASCSDEYLAEYNVQFENSGPRHKARWSCLRAMADMYAKQRQFHDPKKTCPEKEELRVMHLLRVQLSIPVSSTSAAAAPIQESQGPFRSQSLHLNRSPAMYSPAVPRKSNRNGKVDAQVNNRVD